VAFDEHVDDPLIRLKESPVRQDAILLFSVNLMPGVSRYPKEIDQSTSICQMGMHVAINQQTPKKQLCALYPISS
jgi:hypothetical protein